MYTLQLHWFILAYTLTHLIAYEIGVHRGYDIGLKILCGPYLISTVMIKNILHTARH